MLILPHRAELGFEKIPYVTHIIVALCVVIHLCQALNRADVSEASAHYCQSVYDPSLGDDTLDLLRISVEDCQHVLESMHSAPNKETEIQWYEQYNSETQEYSERDFDKIIKAIRDHYDEFNTRAPDSLDAELVYDPATLNPITSITSALSHADWWHLIGNVIFFLAFASALELLLQSTVKYIAIIIAIVFVTDLTYSITTSISGVPLPTLGLSGVVMGMIGLSAYLMPAARIRTFVWFIFYARNFSIPAWILAVWYIGWDTWDLFASSDNSGINLVAHVSGGLAGYLIGYFCLKGCREEIREELDDEIEYRRSLRADSLGALTSDRSGQHRIANQWREHYAKEAYARFVDRLYRRVKVGKDSEALVLILEDYDLYKDSTEIYETLFWEMKAYHHRRSVLCLGRLNIGELLKQRQYERAISIAEACFGATDSFALADPKDVIVLATQAYKHGHHKLANRLVATAEAAYGTAVDLAPIQHMKLLMDGVTG
jgi:membrane associated rhomboid family serine protease